jgi:hypothetical protein
MKRSTDPCNTAPNRYESVRQQLKISAVAAVAALVSVLALAKPSEAKIVYTPANVVLTSTGIYHLDVNHDGVTDFTLQVSHYGSVCNGLSGWVTELPASGNSVVDQQTLQGPEPAPLASGTQIGQGQPFRGGEGVMASMTSRPPCGVDWGGTWLDVNNRYLGLSFNINGQTHYGWAVLSVDLHSSRSGNAYSILTLTGYAYETIAGKSIIARQTTHFSVAPATSIPTAGTAFNFTVTALDGSNGVVSSYAGTVHFTSSDGQAMLPANSTLTKGTATFSATLKTVGGQTITATDAATASITGTSNSINVTGPLATHFSVTAPATATVGTAFEIKVTALDASNNLAASYSRTVHFTSTDGQAVLPANSTLTNETGTFSATLKTLGGQTITATDTATATISGTSNSIAAGAQGGLTITSGTPPSGTVGARYDVRFIVQPPGGPHIVAGFPLEATGGVPPYSWRWVAAQGSSLPPGLAIGSCCGGSYRIGGTPSSAGIYKAVVTVGDSASTENQATADYTIVIRNPQPPSINKMPAPSAGAVNLSYSFDFTATGGLLPLTWSETGALPPGLGPLSNGGVLSGTPTEVGSFPITVMAQDSLGQNSAPQDFTISVFLHGFKATGSMGIRRTGQTATLLGGGRVLVAGGFNSAVGDLAAAELFDPANESFSPTGSMSTVRPGHAATLLDHGSSLTNGKVLVTGGGTATAELFDPASGTFTPTGSMGTPRSAHTATLLNSGEVLVTGGNGPSDVLATAELFDPASGTFAPAGNLQVARAGQTATLLKDGRVLLTGGYDSNLNSLMSAELFDPSSGTFTLTANLGTARKVHTATLLDSGKVLITGGLGPNSNELASAELFDPATDSFAPVGAMGIARTFHAATLLNDGTVLITGGSSANVSQAAAELFDPATESFSPTGSMTTVRSSHTATLLANGTVLVAGGGDINFEALSSAELYQ